eukprot:1161487-Pelagomonas_calceolata.AAC.7
MKMLQDTNHADAKGYSSSLAEYTLNLEVQLEMQQDTNHENAAGYTKPCLRGGGLDQAHVKTGASRWAAMSFHRPQGGPKLCKSPMWNVLSTSVPVELVEWDIRGPRWKG